MNPDAAQSEARSAEKARLELSVAASSAERANRPRHLIVLAAVGLVIAGIYLLSGLFSLSSAAAATRDERERTERLQALVKELNDLQAVQASKIHEPAVRINEDLENLIQEVGLGRVQVGVNDPQQRPPSAIERLFSATFKDQDAALLMEFLARTKTDPRFAGLEVSTLILSQGKPTADRKPGWNLDVRFTRLERRS